MQPGFDRTGDPAFMRPLCFGNVRFAHTKEEMRVRKRLGAWEGV